MASKKTSSSGPPSVINAGLFKTGTASMAEAYRILGLRPHHGLDTVDQPEQWAQLERAAEAKWPTVPGARHPVPKPFTRAEWDEIFGEYDAITDMGAVFAEDLAAAYPDAKVVVVERENEDRWLDSFERQIVAPVWGPLAQFLAACVLPIIGNRGLAATRKIVLGHWEASGADEVRARAKEGYRAYYARVREVVPAERRLEYKLGEGWAPLCEFLGKEVPDVEFPRVNEAAAHSAKQMEHVNSMLEQAWVVAKPWAVAAGGVGLAGMIWWMS